MIAFQAKITVNGQSVQGEDEALAALQQVWPGMVYHLDLLESWADGTWIVNLPIEKSTTLETLHIKTRTGVEIHAERD